MLPYPPVAVVIEYEDHFRCPSLSAFVLRPLGLSDGPAAFATSPPSLSPHVLQFLLAPLLLFRPLHLFGMGPFPESRAMPSCLPGSSFLSPSPPALALPVSSPLSIQSGLVLGRGPLHLIIVSLPSLASFCHCLACPQPILVSSPRWLRDPAPILPSRTPPSPVRVWTLIQLMRDVLSNLRAVPTVGRRFQTLPFSSISFFLSFDEWQGNSLLSSALNPQYSLLNVLKAAALVPPRKNACRPAKNHFFGGSRLRAYVLADRRGLCVVDPLVSDGRRVPSLAHPPPRFFVAEASHSWSGKRALPSPLNTVLAALALAGASVLPLCFSTLPSLLALPRG
ncbi:hypothetical protein B0H13DRAFT_2388881 [Mycena leptocephala]|nr:hypothetical protein B0H13DRAFT_2388881 [Mycena leptocephala]